ncbi:hypothetical protein HAX54_039229 [Datura stramonium]|uniref:Peptidylprolyl isomerase n=1 Tax=Datura stramonium TaxID=4076 RepID=A0ABS8VMP9_DATST|nr:hypothetical protein [Datura stramonium]
MGDAIDLTGDGGVMKKIVQRSKPDALGPSESLPLVDVHYEGTLADTGEAWDVALRTMKAGEVANYLRLYAYGSANPTDIPLRQPFLFSRWSWWLVDHVKELKKQREIAAAAKEEEKKKREEAKAAAAARIQAKLEAKKGKGKEKRSKIAIYL